MKGNFYYGAIWIVDFDPSVGHEYQKQRPAIIIQSDEKIKKTNLITVMALTSNIKGKREDDILIKKDHQNNLFSDSIAKVQAIHAFDKSRFLKKMGEANNETMKAIAEYLKQHFSLY